MFDGMQVSKPGAKLARELLKSGIIIRPVDNYDLFDWFRISVGTHSENSRIVEALYELKENSF